MQDGDDDIDTRATMAAGAIPETDETDGAGSASPREAEDYDMNTSPVSSPAPVVIATTSAGDHDSDSDSDGDGDDVVAQPLAHVQKQPAPAKSTQIATYGKQSSSLTTTEVHLAFRVAVEALMKKALLAGKNPQRSALVSPPLPTPTNPAVPDNSEQVKVTVVLVCASWGPISVQPAHCQQYCTDTAIRSRSPLPAPLRQRRRWTISTSSTSRRSRTTRTGLRCSSAAARPSMAQAGGSWAAAHSVLAITRSSAHSLRRSSGTRLARQPRTCTRPAARAPTSWPRRLPRTTASPCKRPHAAHATHVNVFLTVRLPFHRGMRATLDRLR